MSWVGGGYETQRFDQNALFVFWRKMLSFTLFTVSAFVWKHAVTLVVVTSC